MTDREKAFAQALEWLKQATEWLASQPDSFVVRDDLDMHLRLVDGALVLDYRGVGYVRLDRPFDAAEIEALIRRDGPAQPSEANAAAPF
jgi:hypothetical protein